MSIEVGQLYYYTYESPIDRDSDIKGYFLITKVLPCQFDTSDGYELLWLNEKCRRIMGEVEVVGPKFMTMGEVVGPKFINND